MEEIPIEIKLKNEVESLENRLRCYHEGTHGRSTLKMHVELKKIERIKELLKQRPETRPHETIVIGSLNNEIENMSDKEALAFVNEIEKWCFTHQNDKPSISLNGIKKAIEILEEKRR